MVIAKHNRIFEINGRLLQNAKKNKIKSLDQAKITNFIELGDFCWIFSEIIVFECVSDLESTKGKTMDFRT